MSVQVSVKKFVHMDFSEHLKEKPNMETQSHHFSSEQDSLHCSVIEFPEGNQYFYHLSDEEKHDWRFLKSVLSDLISSVFQNQETIRVKSDNCREQYKCGSV